MSAKKTWKDKVYLSVITELVKEKRILEMRLALKGTGWMLGEDHPRIGEVLAVFPDILKPNK